MAAAPRMRESSPPAPRATPDKPRDIWKCLDQRSSSTRRGTFPFLCFPSPFLRLFSLRIKKERENSVYVNGLLKEDDAERRVILGWKSMKSFFRDGKIYNGRAAVEFVQA